MTAVAPSPPAVTAEAVRRFNRFYTRKIGVLNAGLLDSPFSLTEVRVLYELAQRPGLSARDLIRDLDLDAGYVSRMLARFARQRLVARDRSKEDGRQVHLRLTPQGRKEFARLDALSSRQAGELVGHLPATEQERLAALMQSVHHLLSGPNEKMSEVRLRGPQPGDLGWVVQRHGALYAQEYGWNQDFEALVARIVADYVQDFTAGRDGCWIAELDGQPVGCVFLVRKSDAVARLRLLLVDPVVRGRGVGRQLVDACLAFARESGYRQVELWTNSVLHAARRIYERAGFKQVRAEAHHSFGHDLTGETWVLDLVKVPAKGP